MTLFDIIDVEKTLFNVISKSGSTSETMSQFMIVKEILENNIEPGDITVISGSIPPGVNNEFYYEIIKMCKEKGGISVLDSNGPALVNGVKANPNIIKPNLVELSQILNEPQLNELDFSNIYKSNKEIIKKTKVLLNNELEIVLIFHEYFHLYLNSLLILKYQFLRHHL